MLGWIVLGAAVVAAGTLAVEATVEIPLSRAAVFGLGLALGGGLGAVGRLLTAGEPERSDPEGETMTVAVDEDEPPAPQPSDLFDEHPDPLLYFADEGHGPIVRAANDAFGATFDVPTDRLAGTPLSEALLVTEGDGHDPAAVTEAGFETTVTCETATGTETFRLRTVGSDADGYLLYTPVE